MTFADPITRYFPTLQRKCGCGKSITREGGCDQCRRARTGAISVSAALAGHDFGSIDVFTPHRRFVADTGAPRDAGPPADAPPAPAPQPQPKPAPAPQCTYTIEYTNPRGVRCGRDAPCGVGVWYDVTRVTAAGAGCPATLKGLKVTETLANDHGCTKDTPNAGPGCDITVPDNSKPLEGVPRLNGGPCRDNYALCRRNDEVPDKGCIETVTQKFSVGGVHADTRTLKFILPPKENGKCISGSFRRS